MPNQLEALELGPREAETPRRSLLEQDRSRAEALRDQNIPVETLG
tara:strand:- start:1480 stop:1614 length:135 start_codon:yes stop_codon:yes gene_type:complete